MSHDQSKLERGLARRKAEGNLRTLPVTQFDLIDFSSNDYLGLSQNPILKQQTIDRFNRSDLGIGSTGSRLLTGNSNLVEEVEENLSKIFLADKTLLFGSGYQANLSFFSTIPQRNDLIIYDELSHACIKDGARLSLAKKIPFRHNDLSHLRERLSKHSNADEVFVAVESIYSMDGDMAPLVEMAMICQEFSAKLVIDEAHSTGVYGENGSGLVMAMGLEEKVYARIMTFGKAMGIHGACISGNQILIDYLINFSRPFIYTTAPSSSEVLSIQASFDFVRDHPHLQSDLKERVTLFKSHINAPANTLTDSDSPIQAIKISGNAPAKEASQKLMRAGFDVRPILSPTVPVGSERLRICLHTFNTEKEIVQLCDLLNSYF